jgi:hypothetical protein
MGKVGLGKGVCENRMTKVGFDKGGLDILSFLESRVFIEN